MSASDHISRQFKITPAQDDALQIYLEDENDDSRGFTHERKGKSSYINVNHFGRAAINVRHVEQSMVFRDDEPGVTKAGAGAHATARALNKLYWNLRDVRDLSQITGAMVGKPMKKRWED